MANYKSARGNYKNTFTFTIKQAADLIVNNSTTLVDSDLVTPALKAGKSYKIWHYLVIFSQTNADANIAWDGDVTAGFRSLSQSKMSDTQTTSALTTLLAFVTSAADQLYMSYTSIINVTSNTNPITLQFAQATAQASSTALRAGSYIVVQQF